MHYFICIVLAGYSACDPQIPYNWASSLANSVDQNCERAFQTPYSIRLSARYLKHRNLRLSVETKQGRKTSGASKICSIFCIKYIDLSVVLTGSGQNIEKQNIESQNIERKISKDKISKSQNIEIAEYRSRKISNRKISNTQNIE